MTRPSRSCGVAIVTFAIAAASCSLAARVQAQTTSDDSGVEAVVPEPIACVPVTPTRAVVRLTGGAVYRGTLVCLGATEFMLVGETMVREPLARVRDIVKPADPTWDGPVKAAGAVAVLALVCGRDCLNRGLLPILGSWSLIGWTIDALDSHSEVIYRAGRSPRRAVGLRWSLAF